MPIFSYLNKAQQDEASNYYTFFFFSHSPIIPRLGFSFQLGFCVCRYAPNKCKDTLSNAVLEQQMAVFCLAG